MSDKAGHTDDYARLMLTRAMLQKARLLADPEEKIDILHSVLEEKHYGTSPATDAARASVMDHLGRAILAKARLRMADGRRASDEEVLSLCDQYLDYPNPDRPACMNAVREKILAKKAELIGKNFRTPLEQI